MSPGSRGGRVLVLVAIVLLAVNLRPAAVSVGPLLSEIRAGLGMSGAEAGVLTSLPVMAFAVFGALASRLVPRVGPHRLTVVALGCVVVGLIARSRADAVVAFLVLSLLALAGMATANVVIPTLVRLHFPDRVGTLTAVYSTALTLSLAASAVLTVPAADAGDGWRDGLAVWALLAVVALVPWLGLFGRDRLRASGSQTGGVAFTDVARTRVGWLMAGFFGLQSMQAYSIFGWFAEIFRDAGFSDTAAGLLLGLVTGASVPFAFLVPWLAGRMADLTPLIWALVVCYPVGYLGLALAPSWAPLWAVAVGVGTTTFPLVLALIGLRARTPAGTAALSAFTQSAGYTISILGPFGVGLLHDLTGGWTVPLVAMTLLAVPLTACALRLARPRYVEDELASRRPESVTAAGS